MDLTKGCVRNWNFTKKIRKTLFKWKNIVTFIFNWKIARNVVFKSEQA